MTRIVRWNPWHEMIRNAERMARDGGYVERERVLPLAVDAYTTDDDIVLTASVPGVAAEDIDINLEDDILTIRGEFNHVREDEDTNYVLRERRSGKFARSLRLTVPVEVENAEAVFNNGILTLTLPKAPEAKPQTITVKTAN
jgi:HSP20 family protein